jgi:hypothetical protein
LGERLTVVIVDKDGKPDERVKSQAEEFRDVVVQAAEKEFSSRHWEPLTACGEGVGSYKHSVTGDRVVVQVVNWPLPDGEGEKGVILFAGDHKDYCFLKKFTAETAREKKKEKRGRR